MEYISGFLVSFFIIATALSFGKNALIRIVNPQVPEMPEGLLWIPLAAIALKLCLAWYANFANKSVGSPALKAMFKDSISDAVLTGMTIVPLLLAPFTTLPLDGILSLVISVVILWSGMTSFFEHLDLLLGIGADSALKEKITQIVLTKTDVFSDVESIDTFDFGPERQLAFIRVSLNSNPHQELVQVKIREVIRELKIRLNLVAAIYWDTGAGEAYEMLLPDGGEALLTDEASKPSLVHAPKES